MKPSETVTISELIGKLTRTKDLIGDVPVFIADINRRMDYADMKRMLPRVSIVRIGDDTVLFLDKALVTYETE